MRERLSVKINILLLALGLVFFSILLFFLDHSLDWGIEKIVSCIIVNIWVFTIPSTIRYGYLYARNKTFEEGVIVGYYWTLFAIELFLISPYFTIKYYLIKTK